MYASGGDFVKDRVGSSGQSIERGVTGGAWALALGGSLLVTVFVMNSVVARVVAVGAAVFFAAALVGGFVGFLFGLPRDAPTAAAPAGQSLRFLFNSNLLKVSDFITTTLVGLTLTQLGNVIPGLERLSGALDQPLGDTAQGPAFGAGLIISGFFGGLILMYLWTTVRLREHLEVSEIELRQRLAEADATKVAGSYILEGGEAARVAFALATVTPTGLRSAKERFENTQVTDDAAEQRRQEVLSLLDEAHRTASLP